MSDSYSVNQIRGNYIAQTPPATDNSNRIATTAFVNGLISWFNVTNFGAVGDGSTDSTTAFQDAVNAAQKAKGAVYIPSGHFLINQTVAINSSITIRGSGLSSVVISSDPTQWAFTVLTTDDVSFYDFQIECSNATPTNGGGILFQPSSGINNSSTVENMTFNNLFNGVAFTAAAGFSVAFCKFEVIVNDGIIVQNTSLPDAGDSVIVGCNMQNLTAGSSTGILQVSSGGLKVIGNKINNFSTGYDLSPTPGKASSITIISGNSIEGVTNTCIALESATPTAAQWRAVQITGNELNCHGGAIGIDIIGSVDNTWLLGVTITGNSILFNSDGTSGIGISTDFVTGVTIIGNYIEDLNAGATTIGINLTANTNGSTIVGNITRDCNTSIANASTNTAAANNVAL